MTANDMDGASTHRRRRHGVGLQEAGIPVPPELIDPAKEPAPEVIMPAQDFAPPPVYVAGDTKTTHSRRHHPFRTI